MSLYVTGDGGCDKDSPCCSASRSPEDWVEKGSLIWSGWVRLAAFFCNLDVSELGPFRRHLELRLLAGPRRSILAFLLIQPSFGLTRCPPLHYWLGMCSSQAECSLPWVALFIAALGRRCAQLTQSTSVPSPRACALSLIHFNKTQLLCHKFHLLHHRSSLTWHVQQGRLVPQVHIESPAASGTSFTPSSHYHL